MALGGSIFCKRESCKEWCVLAKRKQNKQISWYLFGVFSLIFITKANSRVELTPAILHCEKSQEISHPNRTEIAASFDLQTWGGGGGGRWGGGSCNAASTCIPGYTWLLVMPVGWPNSKFLPECFFFDSHQAANTTDENWIGQSISDRNVSFRCILYCNRRLLQANSWIRSNRRRFAPSTTTSKLTSQNAQPYYTTFRYTTVIFS